MFAARAALMTSGVLKPKGSALFAATGNNALTVADAAPLQMGTGDFCWEAWFYPTSNSGNQTLFDKGYIQSGGLVLQSDGLGKFYAYSGAVLFTSSTAVTVNAWTHIALVRNGSTLTLYQNGSSVGSASNSTNFNAAYSFGIGGAGSGASPTPGTAAFPVRGYVSNARIVKGSAVYTSSFTPASSPLAAISGTSLLTCQDPTTIVDNGPNAYTITTVGTVTADALNPF